MGVGAFLGGLSLGESIVVSVILPLGIMPGRFIVRYFIP